MEFNEAQQQWEEAKHGLEVQLVEVSGGRICSVAMYCNVYWSHDDKVQPVDEKVVRGRPRSSSSP